MSSKMPEEGKGKGMDPSPYHLVLYRTARDLAVLFRDKAKKLDLHHRKVNIARVAGCSCATIGGGMAIGGGIGMFSTMGASSLVALVGGGVAAAGTTIAGGAGIFKYIIDKKALKEAETKWATFCRIYKKVYKVSLDQASSPGAPSGQAAAGLSGAGVAGVGFAAREVVTAGAGMGGKAAEIATQLTAVIASATVVPNVVLVGFSIYEIINGSLEIHRQRQSPAGDVLRRLADELEKITEGVDETLLDDDNIDAILLMDNIRLTK